MSKTFAIIGYLCVISAQTFTYNNNNVTGPTTTSQFITTTTTLASILTNNNYSNSTPFVSPNISPISFRHTDAMHSGSTLSHQYALPTVQTPIQQNDVMLFGNEVKSLSELPLETLLKIKKHLEEMTNGMTQAENVVYPVYDTPPQNTYQNPDYLNLGGGTFAPAGGHESDISPVEDVGFVTNAQFTKSGEVVNFYDHSKTDNGHGISAGYGFITPQPFIHKFKK